MRELLERRRRLLAELWALERACDETGRSERLRLWREIIELNLRLRRMRGQNRRKPE